MVGARIGTIGTQVGPSADHLGAEPRAGGRWERARGGTCTTTDAPTRRAARTACGAAARPAASRRSAARDRSARGRVQRHGGAVARRGGAARPGGGGGAPRGGGGAPPRGRGRLRSSSSRRRG